MRWAAGNVHVVTINDYLARRDAEWMGPLLEAMGLTVGWVTADSTADERRAAYECDITYASVNEIGFDVLRDQLVTDVDDLVSPNPDVALIDEADSVLVDEALVPLVLAGTSHRETPKLEIIRLVGELIAGEDYDTDSDSRNVHLTEAGAQKVEAKIGGIDLYSEEHVGTTLTEVNVALHAHVLLHRDVHYIVRDDAVHLINASRGRIAQLQRWPDGLQAAVEAKEGIETTETGEVLDTITVQALINRYPDGVRHDRHRAGRRRAAAAVLQARRLPDTAEQRRTSARTRPTASTSPPRPRTTGSSSTSQRCTRPAQPILVGTRDVAESEELHERLVKAGVPAVVLNAKNDEEEARGHRRSGQARLGHRLHPDGGPGHGHPAGRLRRGRPRRGRRARRTACGRHRPPPHRAAGQPVAWPRWTSGRPRLVGVLLQLGGRRGRRASRPGEAQQAADRHR